MKSRKLFKKNPFEIFGLTPKIVKELDNESLYQIVKNIYKVLLLKYHPDRGGDPQKALELNLAFEMLDLKKGEEVFEYYKKEYVKRLSRKLLKDRLEDCEKSLSKTAYLLDVLKETFWRNLVFSLSLKGIKKIKLFDVITYFNFSGKAGKKSSLFFKEMIFEKGKLEVKSAYKNNVIRVSQNFKVLGTIKRDLIEPWLIMERELRESDIFLKSTIKTEIFIKECLLFLSPELRKNSYLFVIYFDKEELKDKVVLEGIINSIETFEDLSNEKREKAPEFLNRESQE